jgi:hypothetical protein
MKVIVPSCPSNKEFLRRKALVNSQQSNGAVYILASQNAVIFPAQSFSLFVLGNDQRKDARTSEKPCKRNVSMQNKQDKCQFKRLTLQMHNYLITLIKNFLTVGL